MESFWTNPNFFCDESKIYSFYAFFCDPTECKCATLRNSRDLKLSSEKLFDFFWEGVNKNTIFNLFHYAWFVQDVYHDTLVKIHSAGVANHFATPNLFATRVTEIRHSVLTGDMFTVTQGIIDLYKINGQIDHTFEDAAAADTAVSVFGRTISIEPDDEESTEEAHLSETYWIAQKEAKELYRNYIKVASYYVHQRGVVWGQWDHIIAEIMEVICHYANVSWHSYSSKGSPEEANAHMHSAIRHLKRLSLDLCKILIVTVAANDAVLGIDEHINHLRLYVENNLASKYLGNNLPAYKSHATNVYRKLFEV